MLKDRAVVMLFLQGGPSHIEFFDPKMEAAEEFRSVTGEIPTKLPGITFGSSFPQLAARTDRIAVVRSFGSLNTDHQNYLSVAGARNPMNAGMGPIYSRIVGAMNTKTGMPSNAFLPPEAVDPQLKLKSNFETQSMQSLRGAGSLGAAYTPFDPSGGGELRKNLEMLLPRERFDHRKELLGELDGLRRRLDRTHAFEALDSYQQQAYEVILRGVVQALDLTKEDKATLARYDTTRIFNQDEHQKWGDMRRTTNLLGKQMLLARRLVEAGCGFVTVCDAGWDMHANGNSPKQMALLDPMARQVDHAVAAFLDDLRDRGLSDKVLLVVTGEMGRTPRINKNGGRDHYGELTPLLLAGGGLRMGQVIGKSDRTASKPATERYTPQNLMATVMSTLFDIGELRLVSDLPSSLLRATTEGKPISELV